MVYIHDSDCVETDEEKLKCKAEQIKVPEYVKDDADALMKWLTYYHGVSSILAPTVNGSQWQKLGGWGYKFTDPIPSEFHCRVGSQVLVKERKVYDYYAYDALVSCDKLPDTDGTCLKTLSAPLLPPQAEPAKPTLVLDLDNTLAESKCSCLKCGCYCFPPCKYYVFKRPGVLEFLREMAKHYELVLWTAARRFRADACLETLDPNRELFSHCLYGNHTKDLSKLGRDLKRVVMLDDDYTYGHWAGLEKIWANLIIIEPYYATPFEIGNVSQHCSYTKKREHGNDFEKVSQVLINLAGAEDFRKELRLLKEQGVLDEIAEGQSKDPGTRRTRKEMEKHFEDWLKKRAYGRDDSNLDMMFN